jgi:hypothetical protein
MSLDTTTTEAPAGEGATLVTEAAPAEGAVVETPEQKAEREASETPEQKTAREAEEARATETPEQKAEREAAEAKAAGAPEAYADFKMPEGIVIDEPGLEALKATAKDLNLSQDAAQTLVDQAVAMRQRDVDAIVAVRQEWLDASKADKEFGGDKLDENLAVAKRGLEAYGTPALSALLNETGLGNHPEIIRLLVKAGRTASEDRIVTGRTGPTTDRASRMYPTSVPKE